jgi:pimeloyl-ACP methyl ester carboxylesterase
MAADQNTGPLARYIGELVKGPAWFEQAVAVAPDIAYIDAAGARIRYLRWGQRTRPGLLLVHGNAAHAEWWSFIAPFLASDYNVAALDLSGMGDSAHRPHYSMELFVEEELAVARAAGMFDHEEPPVIVAHSFGGFVTMLTGALYGDKLAGTVIVDSPVNPPDRPGGPPHRELRPHRIYPTLEQALARFRLAPEQPCENDYIVDYVARRSLKQVEGGWTWKFDPALWAHRFSIGDTAERLRATKCRIAVMRGEMSILMPHEVGEYMFNLLGRAAPMIEIPQARHHVMLDQPLAFVAALRALLADWNHSMPTRRV